MELVSLGIKMPSILKGSECEVTLPFVYGKSFLLIWFKLNMLDVLWIFWMMSLRKASWVHSAFLIGSFSYQHSCFWLFYYAKYKNIFISLN